MTLEGPAPPDGGASVRAQGASLGAEHVAGVARRLAERAGLELPAWVIEARASARIAALGLAPAEYVALIESGRGQGELDELLESVRVGESRLFRHRSQIAALEDRVVPALRARGKREVKVWSAGCSTGEEPFTLAVVLARALPGVAITIVATDISAHALSDAATATYPRAALADVPDGYRSAFVVEDEVLRVRPEVAALVRFERANLVDGTAPRGCDLVWCRNVLIYFAAAARRRVIERLVGALAPGGALCVGYSESLRDTPELDAVRAGDAVYYVRKADATAVPSTGRAMPPAADVTAIAPPRALASERTPPPTLLPRTPPAVDVLALRGRPDARAVTAELVVRLALPGLRSLVVDLDGAELLGDDLVPVLRRARAAARAAGVQLDLRATRPGARRWLSREGLDDGGAP